MTDNSRKTPFVAGLNRAAAQRAADNRQVAPMALPCQVVAVNGQLVTVSFQVYGGNFNLPNVQMPIDTSIYDWLPVQVNDLGLAMPSDFYLGGVSGLGGGTADFTQRGNLSTLVFHPVSSSGWQPPGGDANKRCIQGPDGVYLRDIGGAATITLDKTNGITMTFGGNTLVLGSGGITANGALITFAGDVVTKSGIDLNTHLHTEVTTGSDNTGPPTT